MVTLTHFLDKQQGIFYMHFSIDRTVHTTAFDKPVVDHWLERKIAQTAAGSTEKDRSDDLLITRSYSKMFTIKIYVQVIAPIRDCHEKINLFSENNSQTLR